MAKFDVDIPQEVAPPLLHISKSIEQPAADTSTATLIKGLGDTFEDTIKNVDKTFAQHAEYLGEQMGEKEQSDFLTKVQKENDSLTVAGDNVPAGVKNGLNFIQRNQDAYDQGKVRETEYYKNLYEKAKAVRQQNPGYADYFDKGVEKVTGITPNANQLIKSILAEINEKRTKGEEITKRIVNDAITQAQNGNQAAQDGLDNMRSGKWDQWDLLKSLTKSNALKWKSEDMQHQVTLATGDEKLGGIRAGNFVNQDFGPGLAQVFHNFTVKLAGKDVNLEQLMSDTVTGKAPDISGDQWNSMLQQWNQRYIQYRSTKEAQYSLQDPTNPGQSVRTMLGNNFKTTLDQASEFHDQIKQAIVNHDFGRMFTTKMFNEAQSEEAQAMVTKDPKIGPTMRIIGALNKQGGQTFVPLIWSAISTTVGGNITDTQNISILAAKMASGQPYSMRDGMDALGNASGTNNGIPDPNAMRALVKDVPVTAISRPDIPDPLKRNMVMSTFGLNNEGLLQKIPSDTIVNDRPVQGRQSVYLAYSKLAPIVKKLSQDDPNIWEQYKSWHELTFQNEMFGDDLNRLNQIQKTPDYVITFDDGKGINPPKFVAQPKYRPSVEGVYNPRRTVQGAVDSTVQQTLDNINKGIEGLSNVYKEDGEQGIVKARLMQIMRVNGIDVNTGNSVARAMVISVGATKPSEQPKGKEQSKAP